MELFYIALGGALGALLRYAIGKGILHLAPDSFPWGTLCANLLGCFFIGFLWALFENFKITQNLRAFIFIGMLGALTTFSTYGLETINLFRKGDMGMALVNFLMSNLLGLLMVLLGMVVVREVILS